MAGIRRKDHPAGRRKGHGEENTGISGHTGGYSGPGGRRPHWESLRAATAPLTSPPFWQRGDGFFDRAVRAVGQQVKELTAGQRSGAGGGPWKPGHDAGRRRPAGGGQCPHHPPSHRRYAPALFRVPPGGGPAAGGVGDHRRGICGGGAGAGGPAPSVGGHRRGRAGLPPGGAGVLSPSSSATPASSPAAA